ncbi:MAG: hypothetical protein AAGM21_06660 [Pseudomonadota bacterium]
MPLQNRVMPTGEIVADPARGLFTGNRGILHRRDKTLGAARWQHPHWVTCTLDHPRGIYHGPMPDRRWTALFFLDEAVALAAGHRPCGYCRPEAYRAWKAAFGPGYDRLAVDRALHTARVTPARVQVRHDAAIEGLPDGAFVLSGGAAHLVWGPRLLPFQPDGYGPAKPRPRGQVTVLTPRPTIGILRAGYRPVLHPSAPV